MKNSIMIKWAFVLVVLAAGCDRPAKHSGHVPAGGASEFFADVRTARRVDSLMKLMTLDEKIGQLVLYTSHFTVTGPTLAKDVEDAIRNGTCGNIFNAHVPEYNLRLQRMAVEETRLGIPLLFGYDVIHGMHTIFPINLGMSCSWDMEAIGNSARVAAREAIAAGVNWTFSPMVDVTRDPRWGRVSEGSGEDAYLGSRIAAAMVRGYQGESLSAPGSIAACVKHFAAYGAPQAGRDYQTVDITDRTLRDVYLPPYKAAVDAGAATVMTSFNDVDGVPATANRYLMEDILRGEWGFNGFVVTDYTSMNEMVAHGVARDLEHAGEMAIEAGVNMDMEGDIYHTYLKGLVDAGRVSPSQVDRMCADVLRIKFEMGLFEDPFRFGDPVSGSGKTLDPAHLEAARDVARKSMVLLTNDGVLPLEGSPKIALIGPFADSQIDLLGSWYGQGKAAHATSILAGMRERFGAANVIYAKGCEADGADRSGFAAAEAAVRRSEVAVMVVGHPGRWSGEATSLSFITIPEIQRELIAAVRKTGRRVVLVLINGRPLDITREIGLSDAIVEAWYPGTEGGRAVADVLSGDYNPSGKLTMTFPKTLGQVPIHYDMKNTGRPFTPGEGEQHYVSRFFDLPTNEPMFPFGHGLSYTTFEYSDLSVTPSAAGKGANIEVSAVVSNTGARQGEEVAQLYVRDMVASVTRPVKMLRGFEKIALGPGESRRVDFTLTPEDLSFHRADMTWGTEPGEFIVWVGGSSDALLEGSFHLTE